jgi:hypothetical protein
MMRAQSKRLLTLSHDESPISGRASWLKYHIEHFDILDVRLLTLSSISTFFFLLKNLYLLVHELSGLGCYLFHVHIYKYKLDGCWNNFLWICYVSSSMNNYNKWLIIYDNQFYLIFLVDFQLWRSNYEVHSFPPTL